MLDLTNKRGMARINAILEDLKDAGTVISLSLFHSPVWSLHKSEGSWKMTMDYSEINQLVVLFAATVPHGASFLEHVNASSGPWCVAIGLGSVFHVPPYQKEFILACNRLAPGLLTFLPSHNLV